MVFNKTGHKQPTIFRCGDYLLGHSKNYKYLGTIISNTGSFKSNEVNLRKKGLRASFLIMRNIGLYSNVSTALNIYDKMVEPILTYNSEVPSFGVTLALGVTLAVSGNFTKSAHISPKIIAGRIFWD